MFNLFHISACSTCRVNMIDGGGDAAGYSILALLIVILTVLGGVVFFMARLIKRDQDNLDPALRDDFIP